MDSSNTPSNYRVVTILYFTINNMVILKTLLGKFRSSYTTNTGTISFTQIILEGVCHCMSKHASTILLFLYNTFCIQNLHRNTSNLR